MACLNSLVRKELLDYYDLIPVMPLYLLCFVKLGMEVLEVLLMKIRFIKLPLVYKLCYLVSELHWNLTAVLLYAS